MDRKAIEHYKKDLQRYESLKEKAIARLTELKRYDNTDLKSYSVNGRVYYCAKKRDESFRTYLGNASNSEVCNIKEYRYLKQLLKDLETDISLARRIISSHREIDFRSVESRLPKTYRSTGTLISFPIPERAEKWKAEKEKIKAQHPVKYPEALIMTALDGTRMRSKSEVIIANLFISNGIPFVYEVPHLVNGVLIYSDFTALSLIDYQTEVIVEHEGLMIDPSYQRLFLTKTNHYLAADLIPGKDVFFTFDDLRGGFDPSPIQHIIDTRLKP